MLLGMGDDTMGRFLMAVDLLIAICILGLKMGDKLYQLELDHLGINEKQQAASRLQY